MLVMLINGACGCTAGGRDNVACGDIPGMSWSPFIVLVSHENSISKHMHAIRFILMIADDVGGVFYLLGRGPLVPFGISKWKMANGLLKPFRMHVRVLCRALLAAELYSSHGYEAAPKQHQVHWS